MGRAEKEHLCRVLSSHLNNIHETFQLLDQTPASSLDKVSWEEVIKLGWQVSKQATIVGMLWTGEVPEAGQLEETIGVYCNLIQGFLLLSHGSMVGAGPTLSSTIHASAKQVVDCSFSLLKEAVSSYGSCQSDNSLSIPQLTGAVWNACGALKKTPTTNYTAIGRAITQVAVSVKDVLRELKELKPGATDPTDETLNEPPADVASEPHSSDSASEGDFGNDLSPEEMKIAQSAIAAVSDTLVLIKELIRFVTGLLNLPNPANISTSVDSLERLLKLCQAIGVQIDELGACLYPPQEVSAMKVIADKIYSAINEMQSEVQTLGGTCDGFILACESLKSSFKKLELELCCCSESTNLASKMENLDMNT